MGSDIMKTLYIIKNKRLGKNLYPSKQTFSTWFEADSYLQSLAAVSNVTDIDEWLNDVYNNKNEDLEYIEHILF